mgnify:CR=1 FL=1
MLSTAIGAQVVDLAQSDSREEACYLAMAPDEHGLTPRRELFEFGLQGRASRMQTVGIGGGGGGDFRRKYRVLKLKQEWTTSLWWGVESCFAADKRTFKAALWPPEGTREVHLAAVGVAERKLQAAARALLKKKAILRCSRSDSGMTEARADQEAGSAGHWAVLEVLSRSSPTLRAPVLHPAGHAGRLLVRRIVLVSVRLLVVLRRHGQRGLPRQGSRCDTREQALLASLLEERGRGLRLRALVELRMRDDVRESLLHRGLRLREVAQCLRLEERFEETDYLLEGPPRGGRPRSTARGGRRASHN